MLPQIVEHMAEMRASISGLGQAFQPHAGDDGLTRRSAAREHPRYRPPAKRITAKVIIRDAQMCEQRKLVICQDIAWIMRQIMRLGAQAMRAQVRHDDAVSRIGQRSSMAILDPVRLRFGHKAVNEQQRPPLPGLAPRNLDAIGGLKTIGSNHKSRSMFTGTRPELARSQAFLLHAPHSHIDTVLTKKWFAVEN